jgi:alpha-1,6-mannosyltransferase
MYSWIHVLIATTCAMIAWYALSRPAQPAEITAEPG